MEQRFAVRGDASLGHAEVNALIMEFEQKRAFGSDTGILRRSGQAWQISQMAVRAAPMLRRGEPETSALQCAAQTTSHPEQTIREAL